MFIATKQKRFNGFFRAIIVVVIASFIGTSLVPGQRAFAEGFSLPMPGTMLRMTSQFMPAMVKGIKVDPNNPLHFEFLIDPGQTPLTQDKKKIEYRRLIKYFLASLTTPEKDMWVNLSPYEHNRIISGNFGNTEMGRDMLAQDYILKQLAASLVYPEDGLGKKFWDQVYERVRMETGGTDVPVNTFNKVWIIPQSATVFEKGNVAMVTESHLKVMMEEDYLALDKHDNSSKMGLENTNDPASRIHKTSSQVMREIIIPAIEKEVNEGKNFAQLRQMYNSMILASWFKQRLKMHLLSKVYVNKNKDKGVELQNPNDNEQIYKRYLEAYKKGVYNYIKEDADPVSGEVVPRKYFSGGVDSASLALPLRDENSDKAMTHFNSVIQVVHNIDPQASMADLDAASVELNQSSEIVSAASIHTIHDMEENQIVHLLETNQTSEISEQARYMDNATARRLVAWITNWGVKNLENKENVERAVELVNVLSLNHSLFFWDGDVAREAAFIHSMVLLYRFDSYNRMDLEKDILPDIKAETAIALIILEDLQSSIKAFSKEDIEHLRSELTNSLERTTGMTAEEERSIQVIENNITTVLANQRNKNIKKYIQHKVEDELFDVLGSSTFSEVSMALQQEIDGLIHASGLSIEDTQQLTDMVTDNISELADILEFMSISNPDQNLKRTAMKVAIKIMWEGVNDDNREEIRGLLEPFENKADHIDLLEQIRLITDLRRHVDRLASIEKFDSGFAIVREKAEQTLRQAIERPLIEREIKNQFLSDLHEFQDNVYEQRFFLAQWFEYLYNIKEDDKAFAPFFLYYNYIVNLKKVINKVMHQIESSSIPSADLQNSLLHLRRVFLDKSSKFGENADQLRLGYIKKEYQESLERDLRRLQEGVIAAQRERDARILSETPLLLTAETLTTRQQREDARRAAQAAFQESLANDIRTLEKKLLATQREINAQGPGGGILLLSQETLTTREQREAKQKAAEAARRESLENDLRTLEAGVLVTQRIMDARILGETPLLLTAETSTTRQQREVARRAAQAAYHETLESDLRKLEAGVLAAQREQEAQNLNGPLLLTFGESARQEVASEKNAPVREINRVSSFLPSGSRALGGSFSDQIVGDIVPGPASFSIPAVNGSNGHASDLNGAIRKPTVIQEGFDLIQFQTLLQELLDQQIEISDQGYSLYQRTHEGLATNAELEKYVEGIIEFKGEISRIIEHLEGLQASPQGVEEERLKQVPMALAVVSNINRDLETTLSDITKSEEVVPKSLDTLQALAAATEELNSGVIQLRLEVDQVGEILARLRPPGEVSTGINGIALNAIPGTVSEAVSFPTAQTLAVAPTTLSLMDSQPQEIVVADTTVTLSPDKGVRLRRQAKDLIQKIEKTDNQIRNSTRLLRQAKVDNLRTRGTINRLEKEKEDLRRQLQRVEMRLREQPSLEAPTQTHPVIAQQKPESVPATVSPDFQQQELKSIYGKLHEQIEIAFENLKGLYRGNNEDRDDLILAVTAARILQVVISDFTDYLNGPDTSDLNKKALSKNISYLESSGAALKNLILNIEANNEGLNFDSITVASIEDARDQAKALVLPAIVKIIDSIGYLARSNLPQQAVSPRSVQAKAPQFPQKRQASVATISAVLVSADEVDSKIEDLKSQIQLMEKDDDRTSARINLERKIYPIQEVVHQDIAALKELGLGANISEKGENLIRKIEENLKILNKNIRELSTVFAKYVNRKSSKAPLILRTAVVLVALASLVFVVIGIRSQSPSNVSGEPLVTPSPTPIAVTSQPTPANSPSAQATASVTPQSTQASSLAPSAQEESMAKARLKGYGDSVKRVLQDILKFVEDNKFNQIDGTIVLNNIGSYRSNLQELIADKEGLKDLMVNSPYLWKTNKDRLNTNEYFEIITIFVRFEGEISLHRDDGAIELDPQTLGVLSKFMPKLVAAKAADAVPGIALFGQAPALTDTTLPLTQTVISGSGSEVAPTPSAAQPAINYITPEQALEWPSGKVTALLNEGWEIGAPPAKSPATVESGITPVVAPVASGSTTAGLPEVNTNTTQTTSILTLPVSQAIQKQGLQSRIAQTFQHFLGKFKGSPKISNNGGSSYHTAMINGEEAYVVKASVYGPEIDNGDPNSVYGPTGNILHDGDVASNIFPVGQWLKQVDTNGKFIRYLYVADAGPWEVETKSFKGKDGKIHTIHTKKALRDALGNLIANHLRSLDLWFAGKLSANAPATSEMILIPIDHPGNEVATSSPTQTITDRAQASLLNKGGIDFDPKYLQMNIQGNPMDIPVPKGFEWLLNTPIRGFSPQILDIKSGMGFELSFFTGLLTPQQQQTAKEKVIMRLAASFMDHKFMMKQFV